jgi:hypothetical protein
MPSFETRTVDAVLSERTGLQRVRLHDGSRAFVLTRLIGTVRVGDEVVVNTTAVELGLGTGGWHVVHWNLARRRLRQPGPGHIMKLRYTSLQVDTGGAEEHLTVDDGELPEPGDLGGVPVVACGLHSQLGVVAAAIAEHAPNARVAYVMTDGAALPIALSDLVAELEAKQLVHLTITAANAFGGQLEAVSIPSGLDLAVRTGGANVIVVAMGPGVVGTTSALGTTGVEVAWIIDVASRLGGDPIVAVRASGVDPRPRHRGLSHHTRTALALCHATATVPVPTGDDAEVVRAALAGTRHTLVDVDPGEVGSLLERRGLRVTTMGRGPEEDPLFFRATAVAGRLAGERATAAGTVQA